MNIQDQYFLEDYIFSGDILHLITIFLHHGIGDGPLIKVINSNLKN
jgi:hypothetical protein